MICSQRSPACSPLSADPSLAQVTPEAFLEAFQAPIANAQDMFLNKTMTLSKLLSICPPGTLDPTPYLSVTDLITFCLLFCFDLYLSLSLCS
jgi:hypothetical protein